MESVLECLGAFMLRNSEEELDYISDCFLTRQSVVLALLGWPKETSTSSFIPAIAREWRPRDVMSLSAICAGRVVCGGYLGRE